MRFVASRLLWRSGLAAALGLRIRLQEGVQLEFAPSSIAASLWLDSSYGQEDRTLLDRLLRPGDIFVDVGANIGHLALVAAARVGPTGRVIACEPHPRTFRYLTKNVALNGMSWVECENVALGAREGQAVLADTVRDDQNAITDTGVSVRMATLDALVGALDNVSVLKLDVEGYEREVLDGGGRTLSRVWAVYFECSERLSRPYESSSEAVVRALEEAGFMVVDPTTLERVPRPVAPEDPVDLLAVRDVNEVRARLSGRDSTQERA